MDTLRNHLVELGFSPYEADVYLALVKEHPANGSQLARRSGVPRSMVYQTLDRLAEKGAVLVAPGEPAWYTPVSPAELFGRLQERYATHCQALIKALPQVAQTEEDQLVWNLTGFAAIRTRALEIYFRAGGNVRTGGDPKLVAQLLHGEAGEPSLSPGWCAILAPGREALLVEVPPLSRPVAAYSRQAAFVAAIGASARERRIVRSDRPWTAPIRQFW
jgi:predicted transcriptional regulator